MFIRLCLLVGDLFSSAFFAYFLTTTPPLRSPHTLSPTTYLQGELCLAIDACLHPAHLMSSSSSSEKDHREGETPDAQKQLCGLVLERVSTYLGVALDSSYSLPKLHGRYFGGENDDTIPLAI